MQELITVLGLMIGSGFAGAYIQTWVSFDQWSAHRASKAQATANKEILDHLRSTRTT